MTDQLGPYRILRELGRGGMGVVYVAECEARPEPVALKELVMASALPESEKVETVERFKREGAAASRLRHPNIVAVYDMGHDGDRYYMAMELVEGRSLGSMIDQKVAMSFQQVIDIGSQICRALDYAHQAGVVHRDIKPDNIQVKADGSVKLMDFGVARVKSDLPSLTQTGTTLGTIAYMSPEQLTDSRNVDGRADIFSLGALLYEMLTFKTPFDAGNLGGTILKIMNETPQPLRDINPAIPERLEQVISKALQKEAENRYRRAAEMDYALQEALKTVPPPEQQAAPKISPCRYCQAPMPAGSRVCSTCGRSNFGGGTGLLGSMPPLPSGAKPEPTKVSGPLPPPPQRTLPSPAATSSPQLQMPSRPQLSPPGRPPHSPSPTPPPAAPPARVGTGALSLGTPATPAIGVVATRSSAPSSLGPVRGLELRCSFGRRGKEAGEFNSPRGVLVDRSKRILVADTGNGRIQLFDLDGRWKSFLRPIGSSFPTAPRSMAILPRGVMVLGDAEDTRLFKIDAQGVALGTTGRMSVNGEPLSPATRLLATPNGDLILTENSHGRVVVMDGKDRNSLVIQEGLQAPWGLALGDSGHLFVTDTRLNRVLRFEGARLVASYGGPGQASGQFQTPRDIAVDATGHLFVADSRNRRVQVLAPDGSALFDLGGMGSGPFQSTPEALALEGNDHLVVLESQNCVLHVFRILRD
ncbi:MAG: protein kinase [Candidatus Sericytochromatia bacterium]|nr:protein kinase [Candidatus Sericytochromatia bacterium]